MNNLKMIFQNRISFKVATKYRINETALIAQDYLNSLDISLLRKSAFSKEIRNALSISSSRID